MKKFILAIIFLTGILTGSFAQPEMDKIARKKLDSSIRDKFPVQSYTLEHLHDSPAVYKITSQDILCGYSLFGHAKGRFEYFDFVILYSTDLIIRSVEILVYRSDHGFEIMNKKWLSGFIGTRGCEMSYGKEIDAISGATISATALTEAVSECCKKLSLLSLPAAQSEY